MVLYSLAVNTISTDGFQTVSPHAGSQWILGLFIVAELEVYRPLFFYVHSFTQCIHSVILYCEPPSMMESLSLSRWPSCLPRFFICYLSTFDPVCECVERVMMQLGPLKIGKLTALLLHFHSLPSKNDRRGMKKTRGEKEAEQ